LWKQYDKDHSGYIEADELKVTNKSLSKLTDIIFKVTVLWDGYYVESSSLSSLSSPFTTRCLSPNNFLFCQLTKVLTFNGYCWVPVYNTAFSFAVHLCLTYVLYTVDLQSTDTMYGNIYKYFLRKWLVVSCCLYLFHVVFICFLLSLYVSCYLYIRFLLKKTRSQKIFFFVNFSTQGTNKHFLEPKFLSMYM
jgi:hypothetical protein